jgi:hypothetical protein
MWKTGSSSRYNSNSFLKEKKKILNNCKVPSQVLLSAVTSVVSGITVSTASVKILGEVGNVEFQCLLAQSTDNDSNNINLLSVRI